MNQNEQKYTVAQFANLLGWPVDALKAVIEKAMHDRSFHTIESLAARWNRSKATVRNILRESEKKDLRLAYFPKSVVPTVVVKMIEACMQLRERESA